MTAQPPPHPARFLHPLWALFALLVLGLPAAVLLWPQQPPPERYGQLPAFSHTDQQGQPFGSAQMAGGVWVTDFIFTRCPNICPVLSARMATLQRRITPSLPIGLLSISVDPQHDTAEVLTAYAATYDADPEKWVFVTGEESEIRQTIDGFKMALDVQAVPGEEIPDIMHSSTFVLVDAEGFIRGFFDTEPEGLQELWQAAEWLVKHPGQ